MKFHNLKKARTLGIAAALALALGGMVMTGCTTTPADSASSSHSARQAMNSSVNDTLSRLYNTVEGSRELVQKAAGVLVFPSVVGGSFIVGAEYGRGELRVNGRTEGYYSTTAGSIGFQAGGQSKAVIYVFNNRESLNKFRESKGWSIGVDATIAAAKVGVNGSIDTHTAQQPIVGYVLTNVGLEAGAALQGAKITPISL
jgi:lipid-binding SYLF domain-containing protein